MVVFSLGLSRQKRWCCEWKFHGILAHFAHENVVVKGFT